MNHLSAQDVVYLARCCQKLHDVAFSHPLLAWLSVEFLITEKNARYFEHFLSRIGHFIVKLRIRVAIENVRFRIMKNLRLLPALTEVHFDHSQLCVNFIEDLCLKAPNVKTVLINESTMLASVLNPFDLVPFLTMQKCWANHLTHLHFCPKESGFYRTIDHSEFFSLVSYTTNVPHKTQMLYLLTAAKNTLKKLRILTEFSPSNKTLELMADCTKLQSISMVLEDCGDLSILGSLKTLTELHLYKRPRGNSLAKLLDTSEFTLKHVALLEHDLPDDVVWHLAGQHEIEVATLMTNGASLTDKSLKLLVETPTLRTLQLRDDKKLIKGTFLEGFDESCQLKNLVICNKCASDEMKVNLEVFRLTVPTCKVIDSFGVLCHPSDEAEQKLRKINGFETLIPAYNPLNYDLRRNDNFMDFLVKEPDLGVDRKKAPN